MAKFNVGDRVSVSPKHWLRANQVGVVMEFDGDKDKPWRVEFEQAFEGGGTNGRSLWLDEADLEILDSD